MIDLNAIYQTVMCLLFNRITCTEAEIREGRTHEPAYVYMYLCLSVQCLMFSVLGLSWSVNLFVALFFNPMWFIGLQTVNLLLYYEGVYRPYSSHSAESKKGLAFTAHSTLPLEQKSNRLNFVSSLLGLASLVLTRFFLSCLENGAFRGCFTQLKPQRASSQFALFLHSRKTFHRW